MNVIAQLFSLIALPFRLLLSVPLQLIAAPKRLMGMSLPARVAVLIAVFLVLCTICAYTTFLLSHKRADYRLWVDPLRITVIVALVVAIPVIVYYVLRLWLEGHGSLFPDIDHAWKAGLAELSKQGIDVSETPLFLVFGTPDEAGGQALFQASGMSFRMLDFPPGAQALKWYADSSGIFIVCSDVGRLAGVLKNAAARAPSTGAAPVAAARPGAALRGTIVVGGTESPSESPAPPPSWGSSPNLRGTLVIGNADGVGATSSSASIALSPADADEQTARLEYLCQLLRRGRQPFVPCNGILTLLPFDVIERGPGEALEIQRAIREDLAAFVRSAMVRCPVAALVSRMDSEPGFRELVRRVGTDRAAAQRFGKGYSVWSPPVAEQLEAVAAHACGAFEDWVYSLFREADGFNKPGNTKLYQLLCKIRSHLAGRLKAILVNGFAADSHHEPTATTAPLLFSGCYFAATGPAADRQAFVRSVIEKMLSEEGELEWTDEALEEDDRYQGLAKTALAISGMLSLAMIAMVVKKYFLK